MTIGDQQAHKKSEFSTEMTDDQPNKRKKKIRVFIY